MMISDKQDSPDAVSVPAVEFRDVDILFGGSTQTRREAIGLVESGVSRADILERTGVVVGVAGANLKVGHGEISVLMGLSGSGKSTLLRAANGLNKVTRGSVLLRHGDNDVVDIASCDARTLRKARMERVAMVFQQFALLPWRTVRENVGIGLELRGVSAADRRVVVDEKLELVGLSAWADRYAHELSGGMQQRVGLARAFATDADILLMDEPFSALDPLIRAKLQDELLQLQSRVKKTIVFVSHDLDEALKLGNHITIMEGGRIVQTGTPEDIVLRPADHYVEEFVRHMNPLNVLCAETLMRPLSTFAREGDVVLLDSARTLKVALGGGDVILSASLNDVQVPVYEIESFDPENDGQVPQGIAAVPLSAGLRMVVNLRQATGYPVLLVDQGQLRGVCDDGEILKAFSGLERRSNQAVLPELV
ncbi:Glycine betaine/L-proline transport ATP-binding protein proV [Granulibacter bethesdensis]|uniref:Trimethylamine N-oxide transport system ATP-binding protein TmoW n=1 Tax=Granulibacter bethesdensis TaxID=364410 RepID=A0AAN0RBI6_9PROT|nr:choline ABC transporter ATP-binding protein [Granulibacter bethesdensis]AHJ61825.1 Glycine betaine/L-proline transport ATP-binding protein proV [Granulibacter bethesdensis]